MPRLNLVQDAHDKVRPQLRQRKEECGKVSKAELEVCRVLPLEAIEEEQEDLPAEGLHCGTTG